MSTISGTDLLNPISQVADARRKTQTGQSIIAGMDTDEWYFFVSQYDPWFGKNVSNQWTVTADTDRVYDIDTSSGQADILKQLIGVKRMYPSDARLVIPRVNDIVGGVAQDVVLDSALGEPSNQFVASEAQSNDSGVYVYRVLTGASTSGVVYPPAGLSEAINAQTYRQVHAMEVGPYSLSQAKTAFKLMYRIQGADAKFVTQQFIPVTGTGEPASVQDRIIAEAAQGEVLLIKVIGGGSGYADGEKVTITSANGTGYSGVVRVDGGVIYRVDTLTTGYGYRPDTEQTVNTVAVATTGGSGASLEVVYSPYGGYAANPIVEMLPQNVMFFSQLQSNAIDPTSPFATGMTAFTFGIMKAPKQAYTGLSFAGNTGRGYTKLSVRRTSPLPSFSSELPPIAYDLSGSRVRIRVAPYNGGSPDFTAKRMHEGQLLKYEVIGDVVNLYFVDEDSSRLGWGDIGTNAYAIEFRLYSELSNFVADAISGDKFAQVTIDAVETQDIECSTGEIIYAVRASVPVTFDIERGWNIQDHISKEFRLVAPLL